MQASNSVNFITSRAHVVRRTAAIIVAFACAANGCAVSGQSASNTLDDKSLPLTEQPYSIALRLLASSDLNLDSQSRAAPSRVRVFVMQPQTNIASMGFEELFEYGDYVMTPPPMASVTLQPGQSTELVLQANKAQSMIVVAAAYRDPYQSVWRAIAEITPSDEVAAAATIGAKTVTIHTSP